MSGGGTGSVAGAPGGGATAIPGRGAGVASLGELPVTGPTSSLMTTIGFAFIIGGAGVLYLTRLGGDRDEESEPTRVPAPRRRRLVPDDEPTLDGVRRPRPQPSRRIR
ncbi:hypothetical protein [Dactylosporangium sp. CA-233914]|uniref:hypothetical protein n=1 Tax=Dactylosporangium sp. CA-233914 TaxID=3239934 RepID=UPI003D92FDFE